MERGEGASAEVKASSTAHARRAAPSSVDGATKGASLNGASGSGPVAAAAPASTAALRRRRAPSGPPPTCSPPSASARRDEDGGEGDAAGGGKATLEMPADSDSGLDPYCTIDTASAGAPDDMASAVRVDAGMVMDGGGM